MVCIWRWLELLSHEGYSEIGMYYEKPLLKRLNMLLNFAESAEIVMTAQRRT